jgi:hypothetical protein
MDGYGSVSVRESAMLADVPYFWGLPFAGGSIVESALGSCLGLVQASDGRGLDGDGDDGAGAGAGAGADVRLSTVLIMGKKYLNIARGDSEGGLVGTRLVGDGRRRALSPPPRGVGTVLAVEHG